MLNYSETGFLSLTVHIFSGLNLHCRFNEVNFNKVNIYIFIRIYYMNMHPILACCW